MHGVLNLIPGSHIKVEGENQLYGVVLWPPHVLHGTCKLLYLTHTGTHAHTHACTRAHTYALTHVCTHFYYY